MVKWLKAVQLSKISGTRDSTQMISFRSVTHSRDLHCRSEVRSSEGKLLEFICFFRLFQDIKGKCFHLDGKFLMLPCIKIVRYKMNKTRWGNDWKQYSCPWAVGLVTTHRWYHFIVWLTRVTCIVHPKFEFLMANCWKLFAFFSGHKREIFSSRREIFNITFYEIVRCKMNKTRY